MDKESLKIMIKEAITHNQAIEIINDLTKKYHWTLTDIRPQENKIWDMNFLTEDGKKITINPNRQEMWDFTDGADPIKFSSPSELSSLIKKKRYHFITK